MIFSKFCELSTASWKTSMKS